MRENTKYSMNGRLEHELKGNEKLKKVLDAMPDYVVDWHDELKADGLSYFTRRNYVYNFSRFLHSFKKDISEIKISDMTPQYVSKFIIKDRYNENGEEKSDSQQLLMWHTLNSFFKYCVYYELADKNPMDRIKKPKNNDLVKIQANREKVDGIDFKKILMFMPNVTDKPFLLARDKVILLLMMTTGIRKTALTQINLEDLDFDNSLIYIYDKGEKPRECYMVDELAEAIKEYMPYRNELVKGKSNCLLVNYKGERISTCVVDKVATLYSDEGAGIRLTAHQYRAAFISIIQEAKHDIDFTRRAVGHSRIETTLRYITTNNKEAEESAKLIAGELF